MLAEPGAQCRLTHMSTDVCNGRYSIGRSASQSSNVLDGREDD